MSPSRLLSVVGLALLTSVSCADVLGIKDAQVEASGGNDGFGGYESMGGTGGTGGATSSPLGSAISAYASASCNRFNACSPASVLYLYGSVSECVARVKLYNTWMASLSGVSWSAAQYNSCANAVSASSCDEYANDTITACMANGTLSNGVACNVNNQCASGFCNSGLTTCGQCAVPPSEGDACVNSDCGSNLTCANDDTCQRARALGEDCTGDLPCEGDLACYQNKCVRPQSTVGAACDSSVNLFCDTANFLVCYTTTNTCVTVADYAAVGTDCGVDTSTSTPTATLCSKGSCYGGTMKCVGGAADNATCDTSLSKYCEWPASCSSSGKCLLPDNTGTCQ
jgi:hypothetical protein